MITNKKDSVIRIVRGEDRFAGAVNQDLGLKISLEKTEKTLIENNISDVVNLEDRFNTERQNSTKFRIAGKITNIFNNTISGQTEYEPFRNNLYYTNAQNAIASNAPWGGYPQYEEFSFLRTQGIPGHIPFSPKSATSYNWMCYVSYASDSVDDRMSTVRFMTDIGMVTKTFQIKKGVPYYIKKRKYNGKNLITFYCGFKHNLKVGDWIELEIPLSSGKKRFEVYQLGDDAYGNEDKVFSIYDYGFNSPILGNYATGNFKRIVDINNVSETTSTYYVRKHKILTELRNCDITKTGFERNPFPIKKQLEYSGLTPNQQQRVSVKDGSQTVSISFDRDVDINGLLDNTGKPITELFITIVNKGYMGWFNNPWLGSNNTGIQVGWDFNFLSNEIDQWWRINSSYNRDNIISLSYTYNGQEFFYNKDLIIGDEILGSICEYNEYEQTETVLSEINHKFSFNPQVFDNSSINTLPYGYTYKPHYPIKIRTVSDYVETGDRDKVDGVPDYAFYSKNDEQWRWRDYYDYGYVDTNGNGTDIPFLNGAHYPFKEILFLQTPLMRNINNNNSVIFSPLEDDCE